MRTEPIKDIAANSIRKLYLIHRREFYEALIGGIILIPEGASDFEWLSLWQRLAQSSPDTVAFFDLRPISLVPTSDAAIVENFQEISKFRPDAIPVIDGDSAGDDYLGRLASSESVPKKIIRYGHNAAVECLSAWILEPALANPGNCLATLLPNEGERTLKALQDALSHNKKDRELRENLVWESLESNRCRERACEFFHDLAVVAFGGDFKNPRWDNQMVSGGTSVFTATHIRRA